MTELQEFECKFCHRICSNKAGLTRHLNRQHSEDIKAEDKDVEKALGISHESLRYEYLSDKDANYVYQEYPEMRNKNWCPTCDGNNENCDHELQRNLAKHYANAGIGMTYMRSSAIDSCRMSSRSKRTIWLCACLVQMALARRHLYRCCSKT